jgi:hypothetical protein
LKKYFLKQYKIEGDLPLPLLKQVLSLLRRQTEIAPPPPHPKSPPDPPEGGKKLNERKGIYFIGGSARATRRTQRKDYGKKPKEKGPSEGPKESESHYLKPSQP